MDPTPKSPTAWVRLRIANEADAAKAEQRLADEKALPEKLTDLRARLALAEHMQVVHGLGPAQQIIASLNELRAEANKEIRDALKLAAQAGDVCNVEEMAGALLLKLSVPIFNSVGWAREIEKANGMAGWCRHLDAAKKAAPLQRLHSVPR